MEGRGEGGRGKQTKKRGESREKENTGRGRRGDVTVRLGKRKKTSTGGNLNQLRKSLTF